MVGGKRGSLGRKDKVNGSHFVHRRSVLVERRTQNRREWLRKKSVRFRGTCLLDDVYVKFESCCWEKTINLITAKTLPMKNGHASPNIAVLFGCSLAQDAAKPPDHAYHQLQNRIRTYESRLNYSHLTLVTHRPSQTSTRNDYFISRKWSMDMKRPSLRAQQKIESSKNSCLEEEQQREERES